MIRQPSRFWLAAPAVAILAAGVVIANGLPVPFERLVGAGREPGNWLMYSNTYDGWRFSRLDQITHRNVNRLHVKWLFQGRHLEKFETTPLVVDGIMYLTRPENEIYALDAETGEERWRFDTGSGVFRSPVVIDGVVYAGFGDLYAVGGE